jgi:hypothetical protein
MLAISLLNKERNFKSDSICIYINFASDLDRTWNVQECSMCVRIASSFAMIAYIYKVFQKELYNFESL